MKRGFKKVKDKILNTLGYDTREEQIAKSITEQLELPESKIVSETQRVMGVYGLNPNMLKTKGQVKSEGKKLRVKKDRGPVIKTTNEEQLAYDEFEEGMEALLNPAYLKHLHEANIKFQMEARATRIGIIQKLLVGNTALNQIGTPKFNIECDADLDFIEGRMTFLLIRGIFANRHHNKSDPDKMIQDMEQQVEAERHYARSAVKTFAPVIQDLAENDRQLYLTMICLIELGNAFLKLAHNTRDNFAAYFFKMFNIMTSMQFAIMSIEVYDFLTAGSDNSLGNWKPIPYLFAAWYCILKHFGLVEKRQTTADQERGIPPQMEFGVVDNKIIVEGQELPSEIINQGKDNIAFAANNPQLTKDLLTHESVELKTCRQTRMEIPHSNKLDLGLVGIPIPPLNQTPMEVEFQAIQNYEDYTEGNMTREQHKLWDVGRTERPAYNNPLDNAVLFQHCHAKDTT